jgi:hypothetical protein
VMRNPCCNAGLPVPSSFTSVVLLKKTVGADERRWL